MSVDYTNCKDYIDLYQSYKHCRDTIQQLKRHKKFYIGATNNPFLRDQQHIEEKGMGTMVVLCKTETKNEAKKLENKLIYRFRKNKRIQNSIQYDEYGKLIQTGGLGLVEGENYVYVLLR